jgi:hypothetical protein
MVLRLVLSGLASRGPPAILFLALWTRSPVRRRRSPEAGVVGTSFVDFPRVGVLGGGRLVSEREIRGPGAASDGRTGVDVWRFRGGVRWVGSLGWDQGFATREEIMSAVAGRVRLEGVEGSSGVSVMFGVEGRVSSSSS